MPAIADHTVRCQVAALIAALENYRDQDDHPAREDVRPFIQQGHLVEWASEYLHDGVQSCQCPDGCLVAVAAAREMFRRHAGE